MKRDDLTALRNGLLRMHYEPPTSGLTKWTLQLIRDLEGEVRVHWEKSKGAYDRGFSEGRSFARKARR